MQDAPQDMTLDEDRSFHEALGEGQARLNDLVERRHLYFEHIDEGHKAVIVCALRNCGCCVRVEASHCRTLICKKSRLLERREDGTLWRLYPGGGQDPKLYTGPTKIDGRAFGQDEQALARRRGQGG